MRIISGKFKGRSIHPPKNFKARPTTDFAREGLFNILENNFDLEKVQVLDLFAGTGSISYEFASRGCPLVHLAENYRPHLNFIQKVIRQLGLEQLEAFYSDAFRIIRNCATQYDIVFADPPYDMEGIENLPDMVFEYGIIAPKGWFILEHSRKLDFSDHPHFRKHRKYGNVNITFFE